MPDAGSALGTRFFWFSRLREIIILVVSGFAGKEKLIHDSQLRGSDHLPNGFLFQCDDLCAWFRCNPAACFRRYFGRGSIGGQFSVAV